MPKYEIVFQTPELCPHGGACPLHVYRLKEQITAKDVVEAQEKANTIAQAQKWIVVSIVYVG